MARPLSSVFPVTPASVPVSVLASALLFGSLLAAAPRAHASGWQWRSPLPQGNTVERLLFVDADTGFGVGGRGTVLRSTNGGRDWELLPAPGDDLLLGLDFVDGLHGTVVGRGVDHGVIHQTDDGGRNWVDRSDVNMPWLESVAFVDADTAVAVGLGGTVLRSVDGGASWAEVDAPTTNWLKCVAVSSVGSVAAVGSGGVALWSTDAGASWIVRPTGTLDDLHEIRFLGGGRGVGVGRNGTTVFTTTGGQSWQKRSTPVTNDLHGVARLGPLEAVAVGFAGTVLRTVDGGESWTLQGFSDASALGTVAAPAEDVLMACGSYGTLFRSEDDGLSWSDRRAGTRAALLCVDTRGELALAVGEDGTIVRSTDGGTTWSEGASGVEVELRGVAVLDDDHAVAVGRLGTVLHSTDAGSTWTDVPTSITVDLHAVAFGDADHGIAGGREATLAHTDDGGLSWTVRTWPTYSFDEFQLMTMVDAEVGYAVSFYGQILRTDDGGATWTQQLADPTLDLTAVDFVDREIGFVVGGVDGPGLLSTTDGGAHWTIAPPPLQGIYYGVDFTRPASGTIVGPGTIARTEDGGTSWTRQDHPSIAFFRDVCFVDDRRALVVGPGGTILGTRTAGWPDPVAVRGPDRPALPRLRLRAVPNPFNPSTRISFELSERTRIRLRLIDTAGRTVRTLDDGLLAAGHHERLWDGRDDAGTRVASGVYTATLTTSIGRAAVRVVLVK